MLEHQENGVIDFDNPPVVETVLSVQFEQLPALRSVHFGLFWDRVHQIFPHTEERPPLSHIVEFASEPLPQPVQFRVETEDNLSLNRLWLLNAAGSEMMQIQNDRFIKNWRKREDESHYPHYEPVIKPAFERDFQEFKKFLTDQNLGDIKIDQCEVTYVNHIVAGEGWSDWKESGNIFTNFSQLTETPYPGLAEDLRFHIRYPIYNPDGKWIGRLHVDVQPALRASDKKPMYVMNLTARGMLGTNYEFFDVGRRYIVESFKNLTTPHMHKIWGER